MGNTSIAKQRRNTANGRFFNVVNEKIVNEIGKQTDKELARLQAGHAYLLLPPIFFQVERKMLKKILDMMKLFDCDDVYS